MKDQRSEELEEKELLIKDISKYSEQFTRFGISFEKLAIGPVSVDLNSFVPAMLQVGGKAIKAIQPFGNTKVGDALSFSGLGAVMPHVQHLLRLGDPLEYDVPFKIRQASGLQVTHASLTFEEAATLMPILHALLFCGSIYNGNELVGSDLRKGFTIGLFPTANNGSYIVQRRNATIRQLVDEMWRKGTCYTVPADDKAKWQQWNEHNKFGPNTRSKGSSIRDLVRFCWNKRRMAFVVQDIESAAIAFGLAQVGLCRINMLEMGPVGGVTVFGRNEHQIKAVHLEPSLIMNSYMTFSYSQRQRIFDLCKVPIESEEFLIKWLDNQIDKTLLLGIENGDPPGTVIMTPEFTVFAETGLLKSLGKDIKNIAIAVAEKCTACDGECVGGISSKRLLEKGKYACVTILLLSTLLTIYIGGVLLKGGMEIDQCTICSDFVTVSKALFQLHYTSRFGLQSLLKSWFILRTGKDAPEFGNRPLGSGIVPVLGIEMEGKVHGLRYAIEPGTKGSPLVTFTGHIYEGRQACSCLVFEPCDRTNDILMDQAHTAVISEQRPDVKPQQLLFIHLESGDHISVETCLAYPDGRIVQVQLGQNDRFKLNRHACVNMSKNLLATALKVSECVNGSSVINTQQAGLRYVLYTYDCEEIQSWVCGLFSSTKCLLSGAQISRSLFGTFGGRRYLDSRMV
ncbi:hypothetical protein PS15m_009749 [Mucor circinelloides]